MPLFGNTYQNETEKKRATWNIRMEKKTLYKVGLDNYQDKLQRDMRRRLELKEQARGELKQLIERGMHEVDKKCFEGVDEGMAENDGRTGGEIKERRRTTQPSKETRAAIEQKSGELKQIESGIGKLRDHAEQNFCDVDDAAIHNKWLDGNYKGEAPGPGWPTGEGYAGKFRRDFRESSCPPYEYTSRILKERGLRDGSGSGSSSAGASTSSRGRAASTGRVEFTKARQENGVPSANPNTRPGFTQVQDDEQRCYRANALVDAEMARRNLGDMWCRNGYHIGFSRDAFRPLEGYDNQRRTIDKWENAKPDRFREQAAKLPRGIAASFTGKMHHNMALPKARIEAYFPECAK